MGCDFHGPAASSAAAPTAPATVQARGLPHGGLGDVNRCVVDPDVTPLAMKPYPVSLISIISITSTHTG